jgi:hypothetical protein
MKKISILVTSLLLAFCSFSQSIIVAGDTTYYPRVSLTSEVYRQQGYAVIKPTNYNPAKAYPVWLLIHGRGERGEGKIANLRNVVQGFDYNGDGIREEAVATDDFKKAINLYQFLAVVVTYGNEFNPTDINFVLNDVEKNWSVDRSREAIIGFSLGGGSVVRYVTSSQENADRLATAIACAPVNWGTNYSYIKNSSLPFIVTTNQTDNVVSPSNAKTIVANSNALNPVPLTHLVVFPLSGHGSINEMLKLKYPGVPELIYTYLNRITNIQPKIYGDTVIISPPVEPRPTNKAPVINLTDISVTTTTGLMTLNACTSVGYDYITWTAFQVPTGVNIYSNFFPGGAGACKVSAAFKTEGTYGIKAVACKGATCVADSVYITYQKTSTPVPVTALSWESTTKMLILSDGTRIKSECVINFTGGIATVITEQGITYTLKK